MKINVTIAGREVLPGYLNIDPVAPAACQDRVRCDPADMSPLVDRGEAEEVRAVGVLDHYPARKADAVLDHWVSLVAHGGTLVLAVVDVLEVAKALQNRFLSLEEANELLYGRQSETWEFRQSGHTLGRLARALEGKGMRVMKRRVSNYRATVVAERP